MNVPGSPSRSPTLPKRPPAEQVPAKKSSSAGCNRLGRYLVTGRLGQGGMGVVYEAEDTLLKRKVAIKILPREVSANSEALKRFLREAQAAAKLSHPNVVAVFDIGEADGSYYIVMELITGGNAQEFLRSRGAFHWTEATRILLDVCRGVAAAHHARLIHRDIKPANILRAADGVVKLSDFGLVKPAGRTGTVVTALGEVLGTPHYMSPEQIQGASVDERSDLYSLGATYFALLTGQPPYLAGDSVQVLFAHCSHPIPDPRDIVADIPEPCVAIVRKALAKNRTQRYGSAAELLADLERALALNSLANPAAQPAPHVWTQPAPVDVTDAFSLPDVYPDEKTERIVEPQRRPWLLLAVGLVGLGMFSVLVLALMAAGFLFFGRNEPAAVPPPPAPQKKQEDWPVLAAAADKAIRTRDAKAMKAVLDDIKVFQKRTQDERPGQQEAVRQTLVRLEKSLAFRESITEKGLFVGVEGNVTCMSFSRDDALLAIGQGSGGAGVVVYDGRTGEKRFVLWPRGDKGMVRVHAVDFSHDGALLAAALPDSRDIKLWHIAEGKESTLPLGAGVNRALSVKFSPVARNLVAGLDPFGEGRGRPYAKIWNVDTGKEPFLFKAEHTAKIPSVAFCTQGEQVATGSHDKRVVLWNAETGRVWRELQTGLTVQTIACSSQGRMLAVAGLDKDSSVVQFWDYAGSQILASKPSPHGPCNCLAFSPNGALLATGSGTQVLLWNAETQQLLATLTGHGLQVTALAFCAEGGILATGSDDQTLRFWDVTRFVPPRPAP